jgi:hypothetical protein
MACEENLKVYKLDQLPNYPIGNAILFIRNQSGTAFDLYVTTANGTAVPLNTAQGITTVTSPNGSIDVSQVDALVELEVSQSLIDLINGALQVGGNISDLLNDAEYITDAPQDGNQYVRQDGEWVEVSIVTDASQIEYINGSITNVQEALDSLLYVTPDITNFTITPSIVEIGTVITNATLNWNLNKTFTSLSINNGVGVITPSLLTLALSGLSLSSNTTYTITGGDGTNTDSASASLNFRSRRWWGTSALDTFTGADILDLQNSELATNRQQTRVINGSGNYIWFAFPTSFGIPTYNVNGLPNTAFTRTTVSHTNAAGNTQDYYVIRTNTVQNGTLTIQIL